MPDLQISTLRQIHSLILDLKDEVILKLVGKETISTTDVYRIRAVLDQYKTDDVSNAMEEVYSKYAKHTFEQGVDTIDKLISGFDLAKTLNLPQSNIDLAGAYDPGPIKSIAPDLLVDVKKHLTLSFLGQRTPAQIAAKISERFDVSMSRAIGLVRTTGKEFQNAGTEARIQDVVPRAKSVGVPMVRVWLHSSGMATPAGVAVPGESTRAGFAKGKVRQAYEPRPHHKAMHGTEVPAEQKFHLVNAQTGEAWDIDGPHDPVLPIKERAGCMCDRSIRIDQANVNITTSKPKQKKAPAAPPPPPAPPKPEPIPEPPKPPVRTDGFPVDPSVLKVVKSLGGTTGAKLVADPDTGKQYVMKRGASPAHLREEAAADAAYKAAGANVPAFTVYETADGPVKLAEFIPDTRSLAQILKSGKKAEQTAVLAKLQEDFAADALLGNWDVIGLESDNILVDKNGVPWRIDNGGSLRYRAQGAKKASFAEEVIELQTMRDPKQNAQTARVFAGLTDADIAHQVESLKTRKAEILAALPEELRNVISARLENMDSTLSPGFITQDFAEAVARSRVVGKVLKIDRADVEDTQVLYWSEQDASGNTVTRFKTKLTELGSDKVIAALRESLPRGSSAPTDPYWDSILAAAKTVNHHTGDGQYNAAKLQAIWQLKDELAALPGATVNQQAMKEHYLAIIAKIESAVSTKTAVETVEQYVHQTEPEQEAKEKPFNVRTTKLTYRAKETDRGFAKASTTTVWDREVCYEVEIDGVKYRFVPFRDADGNPFESAKYAYRGYLEAETKGEPTADVLRKMNGNLERLGLKPDATTDTVEEMVYLRKGMQIRTDVFTSTDLTQADAIIRGEAQPDPEKVKALKQIISERLGIELPEKIASSYNYKASPNTFGEGWERTYRWDLPRATVEKEMKNYTLHHRFGDDIVNVLDSILMGGGDFTPTTERLRKGIGIGTGMSPIADMSTGGANYLFTRLRTKTSAAGQPGITFKIGNLARQDVFSFDHDRYGRVNDQAVYKARGKTIEDYKRFAKVVENETDLKWGLNILDEVDTIIATSETQRRAIIAVFKKHKYSALPDGRAIEDIVKVK